MDHVYSVTFNEDSLNISVTVVTVPSLNHTGADSSSAVLESLGLQIFEPLRPDLRGEASNRLANLISMTVGRGRMDRVDDVQKTLQAESEQLRRFTNRVASQELIPVEASPLHGTSLNALLKKGSLAGFATFTEGFGLVHHDPVLCIVALPMTIIVGATIGAAEGTRECVKSLLGGKKKKRKKR